uniref:Aldo-keto reductase family 1, member A1a (aldehyde reductase) n=1 Tax=Sinocyclocheilus grahami TaxID=75366 RepID=A0A672N7Q7_SINGR
CEHLVFAYVVIADGAAGKAHGFLEMVLSNLRHRVECHPYLVQTQLVSQCWGRGLAVTAYSPLGSPDRPWVTPGEADLLDDPRVVGLATCYNKTPAQVIIRWHIQRGVICIPKSITPSRIKQNIEVFDFKLTDEDMRVIESFNRNERLIIPTIMSLAITYFLF